MNQLLDRLTTNAPNTGPINVPLPPTAAQIAISIELAGDISDTTENGVYMGVPAKRHATPADAFEG